MKPRQLLLPLSIGVCLRIAFLIIAIQNPANVIVNDNYLHSGYIWPNAGQYLSTEYPPLTACLCRVAIALSANHAAELIVTLNVVLSCFALVMTYASVKSLTSSEKAGTAATWIAAVDPLTLLIPVFILSEGAYFFLFSAFMLLLASLCSATNRYRRLAVAVAAGAVLGVMILARETGYLIGASSLIGLVALGRSKTLALLVPAVVACVAFLVVLPWSLRNLHEYGRFATSSSSSFNVAALLIRPAKVIADGHESTGMLGPWSDLLGPALGTENPYAYDEHAKQVALQWAAKNKMLVAKTFVEGTLLRQVAPGDEFAYAMVHPLHGDLPPPYLNGLANKFGEEHRGFGLKASMILVRIIVFLITCFGIYAFLRSKEKTLGLKVCLVILLLSDLALGPIHAGRFVYALLPVWYPFAGIGCVFLADMRNRRSGG
jgi:hypothetical protein